VSRVGMHLRYQPLRNASILDQWVVASMFGNARASGDASRVVR
jgi:hypothetical protein